MHLALRRQPASTGNLMKNCQYPLQSLPSTTLTSLNPKHPNEQQHIHNYVLSLLEDLDDVEQSALYHPEGDALSHSLQVYQCAKKETTDPELLAAALLHDVGKAIDYPNHDAAGSHALTGLMSPRIIWLIRHHLDLLISPQRTRHRLAGSMQLSELEKLRRWDLAGRIPGLETIDAAEAVNEIFIHFHSIRFRK